MNNIKSFTKVNGLSKPVVYAVEFEPCGTFCAVLEAQSYLEEMGYRIGSMERDNPRAVIREDVLEESSHSYVPKWGNLYREFKQSDELEAVMIPTKAPDGRYPDFREGGVLVLWYNVPEFINTEEWISKLNEE